MAREAALMGAEVYSIFSGKMGSADQSLIAKGQLKLIRNIDHIRQLTFYKKNCDKLVSTNRETRDFVYKQILAFAHAHVASPESHRTHGTSECPTL